MGKHSPTSTPVLHTARAAHKRSEKTGLPEKPEGHMSNVYRYAGMHKPQMIKTDTQAKEK